MSFWPGDLLLGMAGYTPSKMAMQPAVDKLDITEYNTINPMKTSDKTKKRGAVRKSEAHLIAVWVPIHLASAIDRVVERDDTDRSKFVREAIREHVAKKLVA